LCVHNLSAEPLEVRLNLRADEEAGCALVNLLSDEHSHPEKGAVHRVLLEPYGYRWYRVCGLDYLLKRSAI
jgi:maltose alpha-D-glucosyltransferase/alpha-amylase